MAIIFKNNKSGKKTKVDHSHDYGGFWINKDQFRVNYEGRTGASNIVKALKLRNYQKAIANFVKILSQRDVPVVFKGTESYTDNKSVVISADLSDKNFDVSAGLALHEASHLKYTDFTVLQDLHNDNTLTTTQQYRIQGMINWLEDRRIDTLVFKSCPGYKAYYHKLYDHYFRTKDVSIMLKSKKYREETYDNYLAHIINMMNDSFKSNALDILPQIVSLIDINNITRYNNTAEIAELAKEVVLMIEKHLDQHTQASEDQDNDNQDSQQQEQQDGEGGNNTHEHSQGSSDGQEGQQEEEQEDLIEELSAKQQAAISEALKKQSALISSNNAYDKRAINKSIGKKLKQLQNTETDYVNVGDGVVSTDCLIYRLDKETNTIAQYYSILSKQRCDRSHEERINIDNLRCKLPIGLWRPACSAKQQQIVAQGYQLGTILGKKLQIRREGRELVTNRLMTGKIDSRRIAHAGYGIENVFNQIHVDKYNKANIHITIDASGSMGGSNWDNSIKMTMAIAKAISMIDGLELQVSMRESDNERDAPAVSILYDSRINKLNHIKMLLEMYDCNSITPEGLCLEAMLKKKILIPSTTDCDSYLINICDGDPSCGNYYGTRAIQHTRNQVNRINSELGINHAGFFFGSASHSSYTRFTQMYGAKQSVAIPDASNATQIAKHINTTLMTK